MPNPKAITTLSVELEFLTVHDVCLSQDRSLPFHRPLSADETPGPGPLLITSSTGGESRASSE